ncbi:carboxypeptidase-like regulatory domain-containing protein [Fimbriimonas ginsengisoli]|uniref:Carboxypeptidase regulatory-like domain-containing protein n=1 Tax=Fimbriimonas ginsengisoli Gsoil 348 TaxID=661478 RepID=A0A068NUE8_FIMGI|nr:carboxypeptidase-like regulatory domain-containing protein [Fimbriimonas ginsengisoli]AIE85244.1 hypothetical protein OP10G_1876 [Fimbriimonas ginsengisoli Gsoil 348]
MKFAHAILAAGVMLLLGGCGGSGGSGTNGRGEVSGVVFDEGGFVVRDAHVYFDASASDKRNTQSNSGGVYLLTDMPTRTVTIRAERTKDGVRYFGQNVAQINSGERTKDVNIAMFREDQLAAIEGEVRDRQGRLVRGVHLFLRPVANDTLLTSAVGITDGDGHFDIGALRSNLTYRIQANGLGYNSDFDSITLTAGEKRFLNIVLPDAQVTNVPKPAGLTVTAYTTPRDASNRSNVRQQGAMEAMKQILRPQRAKSVKRLTANGNPIEVDLFWPRYEDTNTSTALLGFGVYRGIGNGALQNTDFLRDPQAGYFADLDNSLVELTTYSYAITALDTLFDGSNGESDFSNVVSVRPLGDLLLGTVNAGPQPTFHWTAAPGATGYFVYIFDEYPTLGVAERFVNGTAIAGTQFTYNGPALGSGRTFYYILVGQNSDGSAITISPVGQFTVP